MGSVWLQGWGQTEQGIAGGLLLYKVAYQAAGTGGDELLPEATPMVPASLQGLFWFLAE